MAADYYEGKLSPNTTNAYNRLSDVSLSVILTSRKVDADGPYSQNLVLSPPRFLATLSIATFAVRLENCKPS